MVQVIVAERTLHKDAHGVSKHPVPTHLKKLLYQNTGLLVTLVIFAPELLHDHRKEWLNDTKVLTSPTLLGPPEKGVVTVDVVGRLQPAAGHRFLPHFPGGPGEPE